jgi:GT2 family glycosyltransferase
MKVVFCLPGNKFSGGFLQCWTQLLQYCMTNGIQYVLSQQYSMNIYMCRNICIGANVASPSGKDQKPFQGEVKYDYIMWIDSDQIFQPRDFQALINKVAANKDIHIVSGLYRRTDMQTFATYYDEDDEYFLEHGTFNAMRVEDIQALGNPEGPSGPYADKLTEDGLLKVNHTGMGWMLVKKGVFESIEYPWFRTRIMQKGYSQDMIMEDHEFCLRARENGFDTYVDPSIIVGHQKELII